MKKFITPLLILSYVSVHAGKDTLVIQQNSDHKTSPMRRMRTSYRDKPYSLRRTIRKQKNSSLEERYPIENLSYKIVKHYPTIRPHTTGYLQVSMRHRIFYAEYGKSDGLPVVVVHGGPGGGSFHDETIFFDPAYFRIIMFDQRGAGKSKPFADMADNSPQASVQDMEQLREYLGIDKWVLFGGSYGSLLSVLYGETHPDRVISFVLRGIYLGRKHEYEHLLYGMGKFFPEAYHVLLDLLSPEEQKDLLPSLYQRIMNPDKSISQPIAHAFMYYDSLCCNLNPDFTYVPKPNFALSVTRAFLHYAINNYFLEENQLLNNIDIIRHIPAVIVHGRYDLICPPQNAYDLYNKWPQAQLWFTENSGHCLMEPNTIGALKKAMEQIKRKYKK